MGRKLYSNNATTTLASAISSTATSLSVVSGGGASFPNPVNPGDSFQFTLVKAGNSSIYEVCTCTARSTDTFSTIARGQEGTTALAWSAGDFVNLFPTALGLADAAQAQDVQQQVGNYAADTGSTNAYSAVFTPALTAHVVGMPLRVKIANTNTSATITFNDGVGALSAYLPGGALPAVGALLAGGIATFVYDGTGFQITALPTNVTGIEQAVINLIYPIGAYVFWETDTTSPGAVFTWQTWTEVQGVVLVGRNPADPNFASTGQTGGEDTHTLVVAEVPPLPFEDCYYVEDLSIVAPLPQWKNIGSINSGIGSDSTDYNNSAAPFINSTTLSGTAGDGTGSATPHNNLQPYRVVRMWRRSA